MKFSPLLGHPNMYDPPQSQLENIKKKLQNNQQIEKQHASNRKNVRPEIDDNKAGEPSTDTNQEGIDDPIDEAQANDEEFLGARPRNVTKNMQS